MEDQSKRTRTNLPVSLFLSLIMTLVVTSIWAPGADAYKFYSENQNAVGNCADCHLGFRETGDYFSNKDQAFWGTSLHNGHLNNTDVGSSCDNCHGGADITSTRMVNLSSSGTAADGVNAISCSGCHVGPGLRAHHTANGITECAGCHTDPAPQPENISPPWYGSVTNSNTGTNLDPCNANGEEHFAGSTLGLDNDGDNMYDTADSDCGVTDLCLGVNCDDRLPCESGVCDPADGQCVYTNTGNSCDDLDACTDPDNCTNGTCVGDPYVPESTTCGVGECASTGTTSCSGGVITDDCTPGTPSAEICDGLDNDCDGTIDNGIATSPTTCGVGECAATGTSSCVGGVIVDDCTPGAPSAEVCDNLDNDCNGLVDDGLGSVPTTCGVGECASTGTSSCVNGVITDDCTPGQPSAEVCDGLDNDCNGTADDGIATTPTTCGVGECAATGVIECQGGTMVDTCAPGTPSAEVCDNLDNDCNGLVDDGLGSVPTTCGIGECSSTGTSSCVNGVITDDCTPGQASAEVCDNLDNDCDGVIDNGIATTPTTCGVGECASTGVMECQGGAMVDTCVAGAPSAEVCDGLDNDCNGLVDDGIAATPTTCGIGVCSATGILECQGGVIVSTCTPGTPTEVPETSCSDALDNDCDGLTDLNDADCVSCVDNDNDGFTNCDGDCDDSDATINPGAPGACDGKDNNCNGMIDEVPGECEPCLMDEDGDGYISSFWCGIGDDCDDSDPTINPGASDVSCNGIDNDCNGLVDEDYVAMSTSCGAGVCAATGQTECQGGTEVDTCSPGTPTETLEATCGDGLDNDCDGVADCDDGDCAGTPECPVCVKEGKGQTCSDGIDNDCDGLVDCDDSDCSGHRDCGTTGGTEGVGKTCRDGADNDGDGLTDCDDPDCETSRDCDTGTGGTEGKGQTCSDGVDNDSDGLTDCADPDCARNKSCK